MHWKHLRDVQFPTEEPEEVDLEPLYNTLREIDESLGEVNTTIRRFSYLRRNLCDPDSQMPKATQKTILRLALR